jgi:hypothetical protein
MANVGPSTSLKLRFVAFSRTHTSLLPSAVWLPASQNARLDVIPLSPLLDQSQTPPCSGSWPSAASCGLPLSVGDIVGGRVVSAIVLALCVALVQCGANCRLHMLVSSSLDPNLCSRNHEPFAIMNATENRPPGRIIVHQVTIDVCCTCSPIRR